MSAYTSPETTETGIDAEIPPERRARWFLWSLLLHVVLFGAVVMLTPLRDVVVERRQPDLQLTREQVEQLAEHIETHNIDQLKASVRELEAIDRAMAEIRQSQREQLKPEQLRDLADAPRDAVAAMNEAIARQTDAIEQINAAKTGAFDEKSAEARQQQIEAEMAQEKAVTALALAGPDFDAVRREQRAIASQQLAARTRLEATQETARQRAALERELETGREHLDRLNDALTKKQDEQRREQEKLDALNARRDEAVRERAQREADLRDRTRDEAAAAAALAAADQDRDAVSAAESARRDLAEANKQLDRARSDVERAEGGVAKQRQRVDGKAADVEKIGRDIAASRREQSDRQAEVNRLNAALPAEAAEVARAQAAARAAQEAILARVTEMIAQPPSVQTEPPVRAAAQPASPGPTSAPLPDDPVALYRRAEDLETTITEDYREVRAAELAKIQGTTLAEAMGRVDVAPPTRDPLDVGALNRPVDTGEKLQAYKQEFTKAARQMEGMVASADAMLMTARTIASEMSDELAAALRIEQAAVMEEYARETEGAKAVDLSQTMAQAAAIQAAMQQGMQTPIGDPSEQLADAAALGQGEDAGSASDGSASADLPSVARPERNVVHPEISREDIRRAQPGRVIGPGGIQTEWLYIDGWYFLGPFPNEGRRNIHKWFPPETTIDLDAVYIGRGGRPIRWQYLKSANPDIWPPDAEPYAIYYAYTELRFDQARDLWIAVGSDDRSDIWINGQEVWASSDKLKGWQAGEGYRKVHFQKGLNRVLYRIENGWRGMAFSMVLHTAPPGDG